MKNLLLIMASIILLLLSGCSSQTGSDLENQETENIVVEKENISDDNKENLDTEDKPNSLSEYERYVKVEAENACNLIEASSSEDPNAILNAMEEFKAIAEKYDFSPEEVQMMVEKYDGDDKFKEDASKEVLKMCPEIASKAMG